MKYGLSTFIGRPSVRYVALLAVAPILLVTGCSQSQQAAGAPPPATQTAKSAGPQSASGIESNMDKIKSDPNIPAAQKQIMLNEMQHALPTAQGAK